LNYTAICTISKSGYTSKQISTTFTVSIVKNTDTNWASISSINQSNSNLINKNFSIGRIASTSCTLSATWSGFSTNTTISYELASNPNSVMSLSGTTLSINTACATKGLKTYAIKATLSNPNYTNVISLTSTWQVRLGAKLSLNLSSDQGGYWNAAAVNYYSGYDAYKAFDSNTTGTSHCFQFENPSGYLWVGFYPDAVQDLYITGFEFIGYQGGNYYGPSGIRLDATRNASTSGTGQTTIYNTTTSGLPTSQTTWYGALNTWGLNYCTMWFYITRLNNWLGLANFQVYEG
jgi:hypothetical protein